MKTLKTRKTTQIATVTEPAPKLTSDQVIEKLADHIDGQVDRYRKAVKTAAANLAQGFGEIATKLDSLAKEDLGRASYDIGQTYWGMQDGYEAAGSLKVWLAVQTRFRRFQESMEPAEIIATLKDRNREDSLSDWTRTESSTNAFSNAMSVCQGSGRGRSYQDIDMILGCYDGMMDQAEIAAD